MNSLQLASTLHERKDKMAKLTLVC